MQLLSSPLLLMLPILDCSRGMDQILDHRQRRIHCREVIQDEEPDQVEFAIEELTLSKHSELHIEEETR